MIFKYERNTYEVIRIEIKNEFIEFDIPDYRVADGIEIHKDTYSSLLNSILNLIFNQKCQIEVMNTDLPSKVTFYKNGEYVIQVDKTVYCESDSGIAMASIPYLDKGRIYDRFKP